MRLLSTLVINQLIVDQCTNSIPLYKRHWKKGLKYSLFEKTQPNRAIILNTNITSRCNSGVCTDFQSKDVIQLCSRTRPVYVARFEFGANPKPRAYDVEGNREEAYTSCCRRRRRFVAVRGGRVWAQGRRWRGYRGSAEWRTQPIYGIV